MMNISLDKVEGPFEWRSRALAPTLASKFLELREAASETLPGGRNNQVSRLRDDSGQTVIRKIYRSDARPRAFHEAYALRLLELRAAGLAPKLLYARWGHSSMRDFLFLEDFGDAGQTIDWADAEFLVKTCDALMRLYSMDGVAFDSVPATLSGPARLLDVITAEPFPASLAKLLPVGIFELIIGILRSEMESGLSPKRRQVFGRGDPSLRNCLMVNGNVRFVDFEYAGRALIEWELADLAEHPHSLACGFSEVMDLYLIPELGLSGQELDSVTRMRAACSLFWLIRLHRAEGEYAAYVDHLQELSTMIC